MLLNKPILPTGKNSRGSPKHTKAADLPVGDEREVPLGVERVQSEREDNSEGQSQRLQHHERVVERDDHADRVRLHRRLRVRGRQTVFTRLR